MLFQSPVFLLLFCGVYTLLCLSQERSRRHALLLVASYTFYAAWDIRFVSLLIISTLVDFVVGRKLHVITEPQRRKRWLLLSCAANLGILGIFKYFNFFVGSAVELAAVFGVTLSHTTLQIVLPIGISFYTFQSMSYSIDIYRGQMKPEPSLLRFALYVAFFPQLVAGPIVRARHFLPQLSTDRRPQAADVPAGALMFAIGLFKKIVIADSLGKLVDPVFATPELYGSSVLILGVVGYACQIYCDFSGYSDMAIGLGRLMGYRIPRNFDRPYAARSPQEFWQRWHISLSTWLRDYLYIPLGGNRKGRLRTYANLMVTMLLGGLWHGAHWRFVAWGCGHGLALCVDRAVRAGRFLRSGPTPTGSGTPLGPDGLRFGQVLISWVLTMLMVMFLWILFRAQTLGDGLLYMARMLSFSGTLEPLEPWTMVFFVCLMAIVAVEQAPWGARVEQAIRKSSAMPRMVSAGMLVGLAYALSPGENRAFIYFQF